MEREGNKGGGARSRRERRGGALGGKGKGEWERKGVVKECEGKRRGKTRRGGQRRRFPPSTKPRANRIPSRLVKDPYVRTNHSTLPVVPTSCESDHPPSNHASASIDHSPYRRKISSISLSYSSTPPNTLSSLRAYRTRLLEGKLHSAIVFGLSFFQPFARTIRSSCALHLPQLPLSSTVLGSLSYALRDLFLGPIPCLASFRPSHRVKDKEIEPKTTVREIGEGWRGGEYDSGAMGMKERCDGHHRDDGWMLG